MEKLINKFGEVDPQVLLRMIQTYSCGKISLEELAEHIENEVQIYGVDEYRDGQWNS